MFEPLSYLLIGFIVAGVLTIFSAASEASDHTDVVLEAYLCVLLWPLLLPLFMVMGIFAIKRASKN